MLLIPQHVKKYPFNSWVKLEFFEITVKPVVYVLHPRSTDVFRFMFPVAGSHYVCTSMGAGCMVGGLLVT